MAPPSQQPRSSPAPVAAFIAAAFGATSLGGCATARPPATAEASAPPYELARDAPEQAPGNAPPRRPPPAGAATHSARARLFGALVLFGTNQRAARLASSSERMPPEVKASWAAILAEVDAFLAARAARTEPLDFVRARVTLEAEIELDEAKYSELPAGLVAAVRARAMALNHRLGARGHESVAVAGARTLRLVWPLQPTVVTSAFGFRTDPLGGGDRMHRGIDLKAREGQLVQAAASGVVLHAGPAGNRGLHVELLHDDGTLTRYSHLSVVLVSIGTRVEQRAPIGLAGNTGRSTGPHLHFEVWRDGEAVDPEGALDDPLPRAEVPAARSTARSTGRT